MRREKGSHIRNLAKDVVVENLNSDDIGRLGNTEQS